MVPNLQPIHVKTRANALCAAEDAPGCKHRGKAGWGGGTEGFPHTIAPTVWEGFPNPREKWDEGESAQHVQGIHKKWR